MQAFSLVLFDDRRAGEWRPFTLTRPAGELRFGALTMRARIERVLGVKCAAHLAAPHLAGLDEPGAPPVLPPDRITAHRPRVFVSSRAVPAWRAGPPHLPAPALLAVGGTVCGMAVPAGAPAPGADFLADPTAAAPAGLPVVELDGILVDRVWQLISGNAEQVTRDSRALAPESGAAAVGPSVHVLGADTLVVGDAVEIEPGVVLDLRDGPIWIDHGAHIRAFTRLAGPAYVGRNTILLGGPFTAISIGERCKVHGEVEDSVILSYSNKAHDGFLGHAYLGSWVNLGAATTNSDLKNNYGSVRLRTPAGVVDTGEIKLGCLIGDHVKTGIGTLLNTGTILGAGSNIFGAAQPPDYAPPFSWGTGSALGEYDLERFLQTAAKVMARRDMELTEAQRQVLRRAWQIGRGETL